MKLARILRKYSRSSQEVVLLMTRPKVLVPFAVLAAFHLLVLFSIRYFYAAPFSPIMVPLIGSLAGEESLHFPEHMATLPYIVDLIMTPVIATVGFVMFGWAVHMIVDHYDGKLMGAGYYLEKVAWNTPAFIVAGVAYTAAYKGVPNIVARLLSEVSGLSGGSVDVIAGASGIALGVFLIYSVLFVVIYGNDPSKVLAESVRFGRKRFAVTFMIISTAVLITAPIERIVERADFFAYGVDPEDVFKITLILVFARAISFFYLIGATTYVAVGKKRYEQ